ncbi:hypothetical protein BX616_003666 [Lobosporangium transversale]|uniref:Perilipin family-domain-containing protein n=1 Tax=Lobosporangium transversale TaxID=64571 RepID=A0A1Y2GAV4_9FUNG|nr:Perilipin family-domain-containing protein [Lobosporangium transversale]KAF9898738.1 hypothetical protein BX616_003666 [Lobosporangium transversale]ORZ05688.1 Perilipin family-domain-containing protein [Lobosporangium transversale]|eukprot:XP_021877175.1 Perilipin family-domain-containing protein [Lobosporangium transversale]
MSQKSKMNNSSYAAVAAAPPHEPTHHEHSIPAHHENSTPVHHEHSAPAHQASSTESSDVEGEDHSTSSSSVDEDMKEQNGHAGSQKESVSFISRVTSIPLIHDSVSTLHSYAKDNKYGRYALDTAGSAVETVNKYTENYQKTLQPRLQPHIAKVDQLASKSLDIIEGTFPIVTKPTSEIVTQVKKPYVYVEESSKNAYTQIQSTIDARVTTPVKSVTSSIASTAASTRDQITATATSTRNQITTVATTTATNIATKVNTHATPLVNGLENIVDRVLPPAEADDEKTPAAQTNQATRVVDIGRAVSVRVSRRVSIAVAPVTKSAQDLRTAAEKNTVVVKSKDQLHALNTRLTSLLESLRLHSKELQENVQKAPHEATTFLHTRVTEVSHRVLSDIDSLSSYLKQHGPALPESVQIRIQPLVDFVSERYVVVRTEIAKKDLSAVQKARNILHMTTEETLPILQNAAKDVHETLLGYQIKVQEGVHRGIVKVQEVNSSVNLAAARAVHSARVILVGK